MGKRAITGLEGLMDSDIIFETTEDKLYKYAGDDRIVLSSELRERLDLNREEMQRLCYRFGILSLDESLDGVQAGELTVISGLTGNGKTLLAQTFTRNFSEQDIPCLWFTYEVTPRQFLSQFGDQMPVFAMPNMLKSNSMDWIEEKIYESYLKYDTKIVFIDHLHYLIDLSFKQNVSLEIGKLMRHLKKLAIRYVQAIFLVCHMTKMHEEKEPDNENLRDSALIACESDNVFFVWRKKSKPQEAILKVSKNRRNGVMQKKIDLIKTGNFLEEKYGEY